MRGGRGEAGSQGLRFGRAQAQKQAVVAVEIAIDRRPAAAEGRRRGFLFARQRIVDLGAPAAPEADLHVLRLMQRAAVPGLLLAGAHVVEGLGDEQPAVVAVLAQLVEQVPRPLLPVLQQIHLTPGGEAFQHRQAGHLDRLAAPNQLVQRGASLAVRITRRLAREQQRAAAGREAGEVPKRAFAKVQAAGHDHCLVGHLPAAEPAVRFAEGFVRQGGFRHVVEIDAAGEQPQAEALEIVLHLFGGILGLVGGAVQQPEGFHRVQDAHMHHGLSPREACVQPGVVIFQIGKVLIPGGLPSDGGGIVPLGLAVHGGPGQVRHPGGHAQRGLPVPGHLIALEVKIPLGHAVQFAHDPGLMILPCDAGRLLGGGEVPVVAEVVDAGQLEFPVAAHGVAHDERLASHTVLPQQVSGGQEAVFGAPFPDPAAVVFREHLAQRVVIVPALRTGLFAGAAPDQIRHALEEVLAVHSAEGLGKRFRKGQADFADPVRLFRQAQAVDPRFVGEDGGNGFAEALPHRLEIAVVGGVNEGVGGFRVQRVHVGLVVMPGVLPVQLQEEVPLLALCPPLSFDRRGAFQMPVLQLNIIGPQEAAPCGFVAGLFRLKGLGGIQHVVVPPGAELEPAGAIADLPGHDPAGDARGIAVLVVEPAEHAVPDGLLVGEADQVHEFIAQVLVLQPHAHVDMKAAHAHLLEFRDLALDHLVGHERVPRPEGRAAIGRPGILEHFL